MRTSGWWRLLCALLLVGAAQSAFAFDLPELMSLLARHKNTEARFTEQRFVRGFDGPIDSAGTLRFTAPDRLERRTLSPRPDSLVVQGNTLTLTRGDRTRTLALDSMPELQGLLEALRATLAGDLATLRRYFELKLSGSRANWALLLRPRDERLAAQLESLRLTGRDGDVLGAELVLRGGDRSVMTIVPGPAPFAPGTPAPGAGAKPAPP